MSPLTSFSVAATFCLAALHLPPSQAASKSDYISNALNATNVLTQTWYDSATGRLQGLWWNSANAITTIAGLVALDTDAFMSSANYFWRNTLVAAPAPNGGSFANDFYDDEGWWALAWLRVFNITQNSTYLDTAKDIFADMKQDDNRRFTREQTEYPEVVLPGSCDERNDWFVTSPYIDENYTIHDQLDLSDCKPTGAVYSYNQGVILGGLIEMHRLTGNKLYLDTASKIAHGAITHVVDSNGILTDDPYPGPPDTTGAQFKGIFARNLAYLQSAAPDNAYVSFLQKNADTLWTDDRQNRGQLGPNWQGPYFEASAASQSSALDCLVAAAAVSS